MLFLRRLFLLLSASGGVWVSFKLVEMLALQAAGDSEFVVTREAVPLLIPVGLVGALIGAVLGGFLFPAKR